MRTTVEISDEQRAQLLKLAAERGEKGFSLLVRSAIARFLREEENRQQQLKSVLDLKGSLDEKAAEGLLASVRDIRSRWR